MTTPKICMKPESSYPPFQEKYKALFEKATSIIADDEIIEEFDLPLIDISRLSSEDDDEKEECKTEIANASKHWGFFQAVNHGISSEILEKMRTQQQNIFRKPFSEKVTCQNLNLPAGSYRWGTPSATCLKQLAWSEAFHVPLSNISTTETNYTSISATINQFATTVSELAQKLAEILAEKLGHNSDFFKEKCSSNTCYLRMNRYPPCRISPEAFGLMPHTDSDFLTILYQDQIGGLQLIKDDKWIAVKPNKHALIINIGDLFQAWSDDVYKSVEHRVVTNKQVERLSTAYFFCPSYDTVIQSCFQPSMYREFSFREFRQQVQEDVERFGNKVGLPRFLIQKQVF